MPIFLYFFICGSPAQHGLPSGAMSTPGIQTGEPQATKAEHAHLTAAPPGRPLNVCFYQTFTY